MIIVITGPTCTGKSETALFLAKRINAEIVNGDAFQCYKQMNIGVAKPPKKFLNEIPHHLYSFVDVNHDYSIAEYLKDGITLDAEGTDGECVGYFVNGELLAIQVRTPAP